VLPPGKQRFKCPWGDGEGVLTQYFLFVWQCTGTTLDENRDEVGYVVMRSIDLKECPPLEHGLGLVRTNLSAILLLKELPDGRSTSIIWQGTMPLSKSSPSKVLDFVHGNFLSIVANLNVVAVTRYLIPETELERLTSSKRCVPF
jgi:hypothetical protein